MRKCESALGSITVYDKENRNLRHLLKKYRNVEPQVSTQKLKDITYQIVQEHDVNVHHPDCLHVSHTHTLSLRVCLGWNLYRANTATENWKCENEGARVQGEARSWVEQVEEDAQ